MAKTRSISMSNQENKVVAGLKKQCIAVGVLYISVFCRIFVACMCIICVCDWLELQ